MSPAQLTAGMRSCRMRRPTSEGRPSATSAARALLRDSLWLPANAASATGSDCCIVPLTSHLPSRGSRRIGGTAGSVPSGMDQLIGPRRPVKTGITDRYRKSVHPFPTHPSGSSGLSGHLLDRRPMDGRPRPFAAMRLLLWQAMTASAARAQDRARAAIVRSSGCQKTSIEIPFLTIGNKCEDQKPVTPTRRCTLARAASSARLRA